MMFMDENLKIKLFQEAKKVRKNAYVPYSGYKVGAALLSKDGKIYTGCNIENSSYGLTICAERTAFFKAISENVLEFQAIAIVGGLNENISETITVPCGACRQVMSEFCDEKEFLLLLGKNDSTYEEYFLYELFPKGFSLS